MPRWRKRDDRDKRNPKDPYKYKDERRRNEPEVPLWQEEMDRVRRQNEMFSAEQIRERELARIRDEQLRLRDQQIQEGNRRLEQAIKEQQRRDQEHNRRMDEQNRRRDDPHGRRR
jgi:hypothetical protein